MHATWTVGCGTPAARCGTDVDSPLGSLQAFRGHSGKAALFNDIRNVTLDPPSILLMDSGAYTIAEFICTACDAYLGWQFVRAHDGPERWKEGLYILELDFVVSQPLPRSPPLPRSRPIYSNANARPYGAHRDNDYDHHDHHGDDDGELAIPPDLALAAQSPLVQMQMQIAGTGADADAVHKRAMSADADAGPPPKGARQGHRSLQPQPPTAQGRGYAGAPRRVGLRDGEEYQGGPFWKPR
ncbi:hypothetical protein C8Q80DRAFT_1106202 [Daedaleopsis nitida]|nr:hypothetical protein C8Q80DRAFT_1106202 [Daedaleopsis nitida]